jgi:hypothetical protein
MNNKALVLNNSPLKMILTTNFKCKVVSVQNLLGRLVVLYFSKYLIIISCLCLSIVL